MCFFGPLPVLDTFWTPGPEGPGRLFRGLFGDSLGPKRLGDSSKGLAGFQQMSQFQDKFDHDREVLHGVGADGVGAKFPIFAVNCCCLPLSFRRSREKRRKRGKMRRKREKCAEKGEKCVKKGEKCVKKGENHSDPIYTNPIKNLPTRQGTEICNFRAPSPLEALHWIFAFFSSIRKGRGT